MALCVFILGRFVKEKQVLPLGGEGFAGCGRAVDLITGADHDFGGGSTLEPYSCHFWKCER